MTPDAYCQDRAAKSGSSFYYSFMFLPAERRRAITALYAFCREVDDVVDECSDVGVARTKLAWWRDEIKRLESGQPGHPVTLALAPHLDSFSIGCHQLREIVAGMEMDLNQSRYLDIEALQLYCHRVAGVVGILAASIFGASDPETLRYAEKLGLAFQLTNIIRDVGEDARLGRIYLPIAELRRFGVAESDLLACRPSPAFIELMRFQHSRATATYREALALLPECDLKAQRPGLIMASIYATLLNEIARDGFRVLTHRTSLPPPGSSGSRGAPGEPVGSVGYEIGAPMASAVHEPVDVCVIGAGWTGLAAAIQARAAGNTVQLLDAARRPGGRARSQTIDLGFGPIRLDNGQHLLMGAYREALTLIDLICGPESPYRRHPLWLKDTHGLSIRASRLPAPWHMAMALLGATDLSLKERFSATRMMTRLRLTRWSVPDGETVEAMLNRYAQPESLSRRLWRPLCLSALNTPSQDACAQTLAHVLRDTLGGDASASDFIFPLDTLSDCFPDPAVRWLLERGASVNWSTLVSSISAARNGWCVKASGFELQARSLIIALPSTQAARLMQSIADEDHVAASRHHAALLEELVPSPITTVYAAWPGRLRVRLPDWIMLGNEGPGEWLFSRGEHLGHPVAAIVASGCDARNHELAGALAREIAHGTARALGLPPPSYIQPIVEKRATFSCTPTRPRIGQPPGGHLPGLWLAGDYTEPWYPATLESAVRSGSRAAEYASSWVQRPRS